MARGQFDHSAGEIVPHFAGPDNSYVQNRYVRSMENKNDPPETASFR
jgi:hypothetical protein